MGNNISSGRYREFKVYNVDAKLFKHSKGKIMITDDSMILSQEISAPIIWPLNGIRRYGCYQDIFLFECGRKCPTGEGLFAFKCSKAQMLNECLQIALNSKSVVNILPAIRNESQFDAPVLDPHTLSLASGFTQNGAANQHQPSSGYINVIKLPTESSDNSEFNQIRNICFNDNNNNNQENNSRNLNYIIIDKEVSSSDEQQAAAAAPRAPSSKAWANARGDAYSELNVSKTQALRDTQHRNQITRTEYLTISST